MDIIRVSCNRKVCVLSEQGQEFALNEKSLVDRIRNFKALGYGTSVEEATLVKMRSLQRANDASAV